MTPLFQKFVCDSETPISLYTEVAQQHEYAFLLESAASHEQFGRYSVIGFDSQSVFECAAGGTENPLETLRAAYEKIAFTPHPELPRFQAPFVGYFSYEVARHCENLQLPLAPTTIPESIFFFPKKLLIFDHVSHTLTAIAYTKSDLDALVHTLENSRTTRASGSSLTARTVPTSQEPRSHLTSEEFSKLVEKAQEKIRAGETFQVVLSQLFSTTTQTAPFDIYRHMRTLCPSPYMYYLQYPKFSIIGSSPETLVRTEDDEVIIRPIAGTRRRGTTPEEDALLAQELENDEKEHAEHMMLVDLGRNDIGRVSRPGSVRVTSLMKLEKYSHVMHLVSEVRGERAADKNLFDIFASAFPAGTLTGAPKIRAMQQIAAFEKTPREIYGGAVGYFDLSGAMDFAIAIRTMIYRGKKVQLRAGAGIVYDSVPRQENLECHHKARGPLSALAT